VTLLIIGVLLAVAILAILGAVFLSISEQRAEKARSNGGANLSSAGFNTMIAQQQTENRQVEQTTSTRQIMPPSVEQPLLSTDIDQEPLHSMVSFMSLQLNYKHCTSMRGN